jgi:hypothetical protein
MSTSNFRYLFAASALGILVIGTHPALAISRVSSTSHTCGDLRNIIEREGAVVVTHPGTRGSGTLYDRYVSDSAKCDSGFIAQDDWVPAKGGSCRIQNCQPYEPPYDD